VIAFVVRGTTREHATVAHGRLERRADPFIHRVRGLDVVVPVDRQGARVWIDHEIALQHRVAAARHIRDARRESEALHAIGQPSRVATHILAVLWKSAHAWDPQLFEQVGVRLVLARAGQLQGLIQHLHLLCIQRPANVGVVVLATAGQARGRCSPSVAARRSAGEEGDRPGS
jgi:hypothetical protein